MCVCELRMLDMCVQSEFMRIYRDAKHTYVRTYKANRCFFQGRARKSKMLEKTPKSQENKIGKHRRQRKKCLDTLCNTPYDINHDTTMVMATTTATNNHINPILYRFFPHFIAYAQNGVTCFHFSLFLLLFFAFL